MTHELARRDDVGGLLIVFEIVYSCFLLYQGFGVEEESSAEPEGRHIEVTDRLQGDRVQCGRIERPPPAHLFSWT
jgi:hypothetical protein